MFRDLTPSAVYMGLLAAFVGYASSFTIVLSGLDGLGATGSQATTGLFFATLGMGLASIVLPALTRTPAAVAWSTPGAAFLASTAALSGGFAEGVGALVLCAILIVCTGLVPLLGRAIAAVPKPLASALLAGVLLKLCLAPALALGEIPQLVLPVLVAWLVGLAWHRLAAMPFAVIAFLGVLAFTAGASADAGSAGLALPDLAPHLPVFSFHALVSVAFPLFLITMAGQNIPGFAVLELHRYPVNRRALLGSTGLASLLIAPFGGIPVNMSAITAAMMSGEDAGPDPARRYWAAMVSGVAYTALAFAAGLVAMVVQIAPTALITAVAGLALLPALVAALSAAFSQPDQLEAPALTFLIAASGITLFSISGAFWGLVAGGIVWTVKALRPAPG